MKKTILTRILCLAFCVILPLALFSCAIEANAQDLMEGVDSNVVDGKAADEAFINNTADFSLDLFKQCISEDENSLVSPTSVLIALAMTANGAEGETLTQMEDVLAGGMSIDELNEYLYTYSNSLPSKTKSKLEISNSIWFRDNYTVEKDFLQTNADYYDAAAYAAPFDESTIEAINNWTKDNTDGMIEKIIDKISPDTMMFLINAVVFDAEWVEKYTSDDVRDADFTKADGTTVTVDMMYSEEAKYIEGENVTGFIKPYANEDYVFAALLPDESLSVTEFAQSLTGEDFINLIANAQETTVQAGLPKFEYEYKKVLNDALSEMGMPYAFMDGPLSDFSGMTKELELFISEVLHKTYISVNESGTKAAAVTKVQMDIECSIEEKEVILNRPFVYAIVDTSTNLPIFIGIMANPK